MHELVSEVIAQARRNGALGSQQEDLRNLIQSQRRAEEEYELTTDEPEEGSEQ